MEGIRFVVNEKDFYDSLPARLRAEEPRETLDSVKKRLRKQGKLSG